MCACVCRANEQQGNGHATTAQTMCAHMPHVTARGVRAWLLPRQRFCAFNVALCNFPGLALLHSRQGRDLGRHLDSDCETPCYAPGHSRQRGAHPSCVREYVHVYIYIYNLYYTYTNVYVICICVYAVGSRPLNVSATCAIFFVPYTSACAWRIHNAHGR